MAGLSVPSRAAAGRGSNSASSCTTTSRGARRSYSRVGESSSRSKSRRKKKRLSDAREGALLDLSQAKNAGTTLRSVLKVRYQGIELHGPKKQPYA